MKCPNGGLNQRPLSYWLNTYNHWVMCSILGIMYLKWNQSDMQEIRSVFRSIAILTLHVCFTLCIASVAYFLRQNFIYKSLCQKLTWQDSCVSWPVSMHYTLQKSICAVCWDKDFILTFYVTSLIYRHQSVLILLIDRLV